MWQENDRTTIYCLGLQHNYRQCTSSLERNTLKKNGGVIIDENHTTTCIFRNVGVLYKMKKFILCNTLAMLYNSLILQNVTYCNFSIGHQCRNQSQLHLFITKESPSYMYWVTIFISHEPNILQTENN